MKAGLPFARSAVVVRRDWKVKNAPAAQDKNNVRYFLTSLSPSESQRIPAAVRGHWSVENLNHYKRDTCLWREVDLSAPARQHIAQNLALTRTALLAIIPFHRDGPLSSWFEIYERNPATAIQLILHTPLSNEPFKPNALGLILRIGGISVLCNEWAWSFWLQPHTCWDLLRGTLLGPWHDTSAATDGLE